MPHIEAEFACLLKGVLVNLDVRLKITQFFSREAIFSSLRRLFSGGDGRGNYAAVYIRLRLLPFDFGADGTSAVVVESAESDAASMLAVSARGDISLYRSDAAPLLGAAANTELIESAVQLAGFGESFVRALPPAKDTPRRPPRGHVTISFISPSAHHSAEVARDELEGGAHPLSALWFAAVALTERLVEAHRSAVII